MYIIWNDMMLLYLGGLPPPRLDCLDVVLQGEITRPAGERGEGFRSRQELQHSKDLRRVHW